jgi:hypothetical protein
MEKQPRINLYQRTKARLGRFMLINLERLDDASDVFGDEVDDFHTTLLDDTQEIDMSGLLEDNIVSGAE